MRNRTEHVTFSWVTTALCSWTPHDTSSARNTTIWVCIHDCHNGLWGAVRLQTWRLSPMFMAVYTECTHVVCSRENLDGRRFDISRVYSADGRWHCLTDCTNADCQSCMQATQFQHLHQSADSVAVPDDSVLVEATSLSDVTGSDTRLHWSQAEKMFRWEDAWSLAAEADRAQTGGLSVEHRLREPICAAQDVNILTDWYSCVHETILYFHPVVCSSSSFFSSPNLSSHRLDVCHTSAHGMALVRI